MSGKSPIQWTEVTWNPTIGCTRVSSGCDSCYAFALHDQRHVAWKRGRWPSAPQQYHQPFSKVQLLPERLDDPLHWRTPRRVFVNSMSDLFHEAVSDNFVLDCFHTMMQASQHVYQILTKRPERMRAFMRKHGDTCTPIWYHLPHIWLGVSVENQAAADERIPLLLDTPAAVRFLSCEPLLGPVDLTPWLTFDGDCSRAEWNLGRYGRAQPLSWVIIGGESGKRARPMDLRWVDSLVDQCAEARVAVFVKQLGTVWANEARAKDHHGGDMSEWPEGFDIRQFPRQTREGVDA